MESCKNWWQLTHFSLFNNCYLYVDVADYFADNFFVQAQMRVKFRHDMVSDELPFRFVVCLTNKKNAAKFEHTMQELKNKMLLFGYVDYCQFCDEFDHVMEFGVAKEGAKYFKIDFVGGEET